jgi:hypothetical protein
MTKEEANKVLPVLAKLVATATRDGDEDIALATLKLQEMICRRVLRLAPPKKR